MKNICDWIEDKVYDRSLFSDTCDDASEFGMPAGVLRAQAAAEGYCLEELEHACEGDVSTYLMMALNSLLTGSSGTMDQALRGIPLANAALVAFGAAGCVGPIGIMLAETGGKPMRDVFEDDPRPKWILIVNGDESEIQLQTTALATYPQELRNRDLVVLAIRRDHVSVEHGDCRCHAKASDLAARYGLSLDQFWCALIDRDDCMKWAAPEPTRFENIISVIDEMPLRDAENSARQPAQVG